jgi:hypothetical protein
VVAARASGCDVRSMTENTSPSMSERVTSAGRTCLLRGKKQDITKR